MKLNEAKHILESLGYNIKNPYINEEKVLLNELMARFTPGRYTGRFKGLQDAGNVTIELNNGNKAEEAAKALSDVDNIFQTAMTQGIKTTQTKKLDNLIKNYTTILNAIKDLPEVNQETVNDIVKKIDWLQGKKDADEEIIAGEWKAAGLATTTHSKDDTALDFNTLVKNISAQISSLKSKGGNNVEQIVARIDDLAGREGLTQAQLDKVEELRSKLEVATAVGARAAANRGRALTFKSDRPLKITRATRRLTALGINFTQNEDGTVTVTDTPRKVAQAKEELEAIGVEFVQAADENAEEPNASVTIKFGDEDSKAIGIEEAQNRNLTVDENELTVTFTGTAEKVDDFKFELGVIAGLDYEEVVDDGEPLAEMEESTETEKPKEPVMNESTQTLNEQVENKKEDEEEDVDPVLATAADFLLW